jgi:hypothetical protein
VITSTISCCNIDSPVVAFVFVMLLVCVFVALTRACWASAHACRACVCCQADGVTPLFGASQEGRIEVVAALLAAGVNVDTAAVCTEDAVTKFVTVASVLVYM